MTPGERRIYNAEEMLLVRRGRTPDAKVMWHRRYALASEAERRTMMRLVGDDPSGTDPNGCIGKVQHANKAAASAAIHRQTRSKGLGRRRTGRTHVQPFKCKLCGFWHVGATDL